MSGINNDTIPNYRYYEALKCLQQNPDGMTTNAMLKWCRQQIGSEMPNDVGVMSRIVYNLRGISPKAIASHEAGGIKCHKITPHGLELIKRYEQDNDISVNTARDRMDQHAPTMAEIETPATTQTATAQPVDKIDDDTSEDAASEPDPSETGYTLDPSDEIESALITMARYMRESRNAPTAPRIHRKIEKLQLLSFLRTWLGKLNDDVDYVLGDIIKDLDALDEINLEAA